MTAEILISPHYWGFRGKNGLFVQSPVAGRCHEVTDRRKITFSSEGRRHTQNVAQYSSISAGRLLLSLMPSYMRDRLSCKSQLLAHLSDAQGRLLSALAPAHRLTFGHPRPSTRRGLERRKVMTFEPQRHTRGVENGID